MTEHADNGAHEGRVAFGLGVDLRRYTGDTLFTRGTGGGAVAVALPTWATGAGVFADQLAATCASGVLTTLPALYDAAWDALGGLAGDLDLVILPDSGLLEFQGGESYKLKAGAINAAWGFDTAETDAVNDGGVWKATATTRPRWGNVDGAPQVETASGDIDLGAFRLHSPFVGLVDASGGQHIEAVDNAAIDTAGGGGTPDCGVRWYVTIDGRVGWAAPTGTVSGITSWSIRAVRQLLGWTGSETVTTAAGLDYQEGERPCFRFWRPSRHLIRDTASVDLPTEAQRLTNGAIAGNTRGRFTLDEWQIILDGPGDAETDYDRIVGYWAPAAERGALISVWQAWPEHRAYQNALEVDADTAAFTAEVTSADRYQGRVDCRMAAGAAEVMPFRYPGRLRRAMPLTLMTQRREP